MPELPEVETTCRGVAPHVTGARVVQVIVRQPRLRWPIPALLAEKLSGQIITQVTRRAKYLLLCTDAGTAMIHLGMSGRLRVLAAHTPVQKHDHVDIVFDNGQCLRFNDPRRFGALLWAEDDPLTHTLLAKLGPEPLEADFSGQTLFTASRGRKIPVKALLMDNHVVVGVGNIYANESLFAAGIDPRRAAGRIARARYDRLAEAVKAVLARAIECGGTTLQDFTQADGQPGYFRIELAVYDRAGQACVKCQRPLQHCVIGQRSTFFCSTCQR